MAKVQQNRKRKSESKYRKVVIIGAVVVVTVVLAGFLLAFFTRNQTLYTPDKATVKTDAQAALGAVRLQGEEVYSDFVDGGCGNNTVGLQVSYGCGFTGHKYFRVKGSLAENMRAVDTSLRSSGWQRVLFTHQTEGEFEQVLDGELDNLIAYRNPNGFGKTRAYAGFYVDKQHVSDGEIKRLIDSGAIKVPAEGEYVYGIRVGATYWACTNESFFQPCPQPPNEPKR